MKKEKVAILADSGTDIPPDFIREHSIFIAPLKIIYKNREYEDRVDITPREIYERMNSEIPRTSLPDANHVTSLLERMTDEGYTDVIIITISSGLSGTHNQLRILAEDYGRIRSHLVDTLNIGIGAGFQAMLAARLLREGTDIKEVLEKLKVSIKASKTYFCLDTLEYLVKGGRIGRAQALLGSVLKLRPVISCNAEGIYETVAKVRGNAQALAKTIAMAANEAGRYKKVAVGVTHGSAATKAAEVMEELKQKLTNCEQFISTDVSPALSVHTGPGLIGISVQALPG